MFEIDNIDLNDLKSSVKPSVVKDTLQTKVAFQVVSFLRK